MTPATLVRATQCQPIPGLTILEKIEDPLRLCTIYATEDGDLVVTFGGLPAGGDGTHYLNRRDPMAWVPWWIFGLKRRGQVVRIGPKGWPKLGAHEPGAYIAELESIEEKGGSPWP